MDRDNKIGPGELSELSVCGRTAGRERIDGREEGGGGEGGEMKQRKLLVCVMNFYRRSYI